MSQAGAGPIISTRLDNGLLVLLKPIHTAPLISQWVWYRVGSRNERPGITGISHWVEHMQFKGTPTFPAGLLDRAISRDGGVWNAFTWLDWTAYYETMPADRIDLALRLEADRMANSTFELEEVESERTVIISERQGHENQPSFRLSEEVQAAAFRVHSYHHEVIGDMSDLYTITRDDLYHHYRTYYVPSNAVLCLAGDFEPDEILPRIQALYSGIEPGPAVKFQPRPEPQQSGERRVTVTGSDETPLVEIAYRAPTPDSDDFYALAVMDSILAGASSFSPAGSGLSNKTSRLYRALVEGGLAAGVRAGLAATIDPFLYSFNLTCRAESDPLEVVAAFDAQLEHLQDKGVEDAEVAQASKQAQALFAYDSESITNQAFWMGYSEMFADYDWFETYLERVSAVTPADIERVAGNYLSTNRRVVGVYHPNGS